MALAGPDSSRWSPSASRVLSNELARRPSSEAGEDVDRIASQARQAIRESRRLLDTSSRSGLGSVASDALSSVPAPAREVVVVEDPEELRRRQNMEAEQTALELERNFDEALRKHKLATRQAEALLSECQAEMETRKAVSGSGGPGAEAREEATRLRQAAKKAEESARQQASEQREVRQRLQQLIDVAKAEVSSVAQQRADALKQRQAAARRQQKQLQKAQATCAELSQEVQEKKRLCEETDRQIASTGQSITSSRRAATEVAALAGALRSRLDGEEETEALEPAESVEGSLCDTGGSDTGVRRWELAETTLSAKVAAARDRCRSLEEQALMSATRAEELSALVEHYQLQLTHPSEISENSLSTELRAVREEHAELKKAHRQALAELDGQNLQKLVTSLTEPSRSARSECTASPTSPAQPSEAALKIAHCEAEHVHQLCLVEQRLAEHELSQYQARVAGPEIHAAMATLQDLQIRAKQKSAQLAIRSLHQLGNRLEHFIQAGQVHDLEFTAGKIAPVLADSLKSGVHRSLDVAKLELQSSESKLSALPRLPGTLEELQESIYHTSDLEAECLGRAELCADLRASVEALQAEAATCTQQREEELLRGVALRSRLEEALRAEAAMGVELRSKLQEECREVKATVQGMELSYNEEAHACTRLRGELFAEEEAAKKLAIRLACFERSDAELDERRQQLQSRISAVCLALDFKAANAQQLHEEAQASCEARARAAVAIQAERAALHAAVANLEAEKQASLSQEWFLQEEGPIAE